MSSTENVTRESHAEDEQVPREGEPPQKSKKPFAFYMSLLSLGLLSLIISWDATSLAVALPAITRDLQGTTFQSFWASISFILGVVVSQPIYVSVSDILGRKPPLYASMVLFSAGAIVFATADSMIVLIAGRLLQGLGGGGLDVLEEMILADITSLRERPMYLGCLSFAMASGSITGPIVGAVFSQFVSWRWIGWVNLPIVGLAFVMCFFFLHLRAIPMTWGEKIDQLDLIGMVLFTIGATLLALPLSWADTLYTWSSWRTTVPFIIGFSVLVAFGFYEKRPKQPLIPYRILSSITSVMTIAMGFIHGAILYTMLLYIPLFFQAVFLEAPLEAAKSTLTVCILVVLFSFVAPVIVELTRRYRLLLWVGWLLTTVFLGLWCIVGKDTSRTEAYVIQAFLGAGAGILFTGIKIPMQASAVKVDDTGLAVGMLCVFRLFGGLVGLAIGSTSFNSVFQKQIAALGPLPAQIKILHDPSQAVRFIPSMTTLDLPVDSRLVDVYQESFRAIWIVMTAFSGMGFVVSCFIKELSLENDDIGRQGFEPGS